MNNQNNTCSDHVIYEPNCQRCGSASIKSELEQIWVNLDVTNRLAQISGEKVDDYHDVVNDGMGHQTCAITQLQKKFDRLSEQYFALVRRVDHIVNTSLPTPKSQTSISHSWPTDQEMTWIKGQQLPRAKLKCVSCNLQEVVEANIYFCYCCLNNFNARPR